MTKPNDARLPLAGVDLSGADLTYTKLEDAILTGATLPDDLTGAILTGAILEGRTDITDAILPEQKRPQDEPSDEFGVLPLGDGRGGR